MAASDPTPESLGPTEVVHAAAPKPSEAPASAPTGTAVPGRRRRSLFWPIIAVILVGELWLFGRRGEVEVCVGKKDVHDFGLLGQERSDDNRWSFPRCERRLNLGMRSGFTEARDEAVKVACRGATTFRLREEAKACVAAANGWEHRVTTRQIPPWDVRYRKQLFWFVP